MPSQKNVYTAIVDRYLIEQLVEYSIEHPVSRGYRSYYIVFRDRGMHNLIIITNNIWFTGIMIVGAATDMDTCYSSII